MNTIVPNHIIDTLRYLTLRRLTTISCTLLFQINNRNRLGRYFNFPGNRSVDWLGEMDAARWIVHVPYYHIGFFKESQKSKYICAPPFYYRKQIWHNPNRDINV